jgi:flagellar basal-body rod protein FlgC
MSLFSIFDMAGSAMNAQTVRLNVTASNLANAGTVSGSAAQTYRARHAVFAPLVKESSFDSELDGAGVKVTGILTSRAEPRQEYQPEHPLADAEGYVYLPNVNAVEEMANMISASRSYQSNVEVINTSKQLLMRTLNLGQ